MVAVREGEQVVKVSLPQRLQEAIDEAAMRLGESDAGAYLYGRVRTDWTPVGGGAQTAAERISAEPEEQWSTDAVAVYLDGPGPAAS